MSAPAFVALRISVGVSAPGTQGASPSCAAAMTAGRKTGETTYWAPAAIASRAVGASRTLPTPIRASPPIARQHLAITSSAFGVVIVISMQSTPPAKRAFATSTSCSLLRARTTATTPLSHRRRTFSWRVAISGSLSAQRRSAARPAGTMCAQCGSRK